jgi:hypothetical protein
MSKPVAWVKQWGMELAKTPLAGVYRRKLGGYYVRCRVVDPKTGSLRTIEKSLPDEANAKQAFAWLQNERRGVKNGVVPEKRSKPRFATFANSVLERKIATLDIKSAAGREKWTYALAKLIGGAKGVPGFGELFIDQIRHADVVEWRAGLGKLVTDGTYRPSYVNDWIGVLRVVMKAAVAEYELPRDPMLGIADFDKALHRTYTREEPNSLVSPEVRAFFSWARDRFPQHFAYALLGLSLGQRECTLRPLRRSGPTPDFIPCESLLLIRRSHTRGQVVMDMTKTKRDQTLKLPPALVRVLEWHVETQLTTDAMKASELLFPAEDGRLRGPSGLRKFFDAAEKELGLNKNITGRSLRRTFQDLTREAEVDAVITKAISGHATDAMRIHYSTARDSEVQDGIAKVIDLAGVHEARDGGAPSGGLGGGLPAESRGGSRV